MLLLLRPSVPFTRWASASSTPRENPSKSKAPVEERGTRKQQGGSLYGGRSRENNGRNVNNETPSEIVRRESPRAPSSSTGAPCPPAGQPGRGSHEKFELRTRLTRRTVRSRLRSDREISIREHFGRAQESTSSVRRDVGLPSPNSAAVGTRGAGAANGNARFLLLLCLRANVHRFTEIAGAPHQGPGPRQLPSRVCAVNFEIPATRIIYIISFVRIFPFFFFLT